MTTTEPARPARAPTTILRPPWPPTGTGGTLRAPYLATRAGEQGAWLSPPVLLVQTYGMPQWMASEAASFTITDLSVFITDL